MRVAVDVDEVLEDVSILLLVELNDVVDLYCVGRSLSDALDELVH